jgi:hypothetical protein
LWFLEEALSPRIRITKFLYGVSSLGGEDVPPPPQQLAHHRGVVSALLFLRWRPLLLFGNTLFPSVSVLAGYEIDIGQDLFLHGTR